MYLRIQNSVFHFQRLCPKSGYVVSLTYISPNNCLKLSGNYVYHLLWNYETAHFATHLVSQDCHKKDTVSSQRELTSSIANGDGRFPLWTRNLWFTHNIRGRVKNYPQCSYILCSWLHCWLGMMWYMWSTSLLLLWCRCDFDCRFMSWVLCHKLRRSIFHLHQRRAEGSDPIFMGWMCTRCRNA
jgi:hypothetical protein